MFEEFGDGEQSNDTYRVIRLRVVIDVAIEKQEEQNDEGFEEGALIEVV